MTGEDAGNFVERGIPHELENFEWFRQSAEIQEAKRKKHKA